MATAPKTGKLPAAAATPTRNRNGTDGESRTGKPRIVLILQGGGALGAYHIGAFQAMQEAGYAPDWVSGISIGAINSAVIVGTPAPERLDKLERLWSEISRPDEWGSWLGGSFLRAFNQTSAAEAILFGQPNFWFPRVPSPLLLPQTAPEAASFCDTSPMRATLQRLVDFDLINSGATRLSLGATQVTTGDLVFFDNTRQAIGPEHVLASGSLPPGFAATRVEGELYWDGGCVSNTPLDAIYEDGGDDDLLVFMIDLWGAFGTAPTTMDQVSWRQKQIQYASRTAHAIRSLANQHNLHCMLQSVAGHLPAGALDIAAVSGAAAMESGRHIHIVHVIYHPSDDQVSESDAEFSRPSIAKRRAAGYQDLKLAIEASPWNHARGFAGQGCFVHRVHRSQVEPNLAMQTAARSFMPA